LTAPDLLAGAAADMGLSIKNKQNYPILLDEKFNQLDHSCLIDQLFNSSEKRLARTLLLLARYGKEDKPFYIRYANPHEDAPRQDQNHHAGDLSASSR